MRSQDSLVGTATRYKLDDQGVMVQFMVGEQDFYVLHNVRTGSGSHPASYIMVTGGCFLKDKVAEV